RMANAKDAREALRILAETDYGSKVSELASPHDYENMLESELREVYDFINTVTPDEAITDLFFIKHDIHNIKVLLKSKALEVEEPNFLSGLGIVPLDVIKEALDSEEKGLYNALPSFIADALKDIENMTADPQYIDIALDRAMYGYILNTASKRRQIFVEEFFRRQVDMLNIRSLLRAKAMGEDFIFAKKLFMPYGSIDENVLAEAYELSYDSLAKHFSSTIYYDVIDRGIRDFQQNGTFAEFERLLENFLLDYVSVGKWELMGIQPIMGYILAKENEIAAIRLIMVGKINNIPAEKIRERLRDTYV
ncbi:MAG: V-type ATP synthase subunit C, partial [Clostridiales bacterium]|nr:V-type ATP synthase subunit C [Clostridiales bacterium]